MRLLVGGFLIVAALVNHERASAFSTPIAPPNNGSVRQSTIPINAAGTDTSALTGSGVNVLSWAIDRPVEGGVMRKNPGERTWYFVRGISEAELRAAHDRFLDEMVQKHGNEPRDIVIEVKDSADVAALRALEITVPEPTPCTVSRQVLYRHLPALRRAGILYWAKGGPKPLRSTTQESAAPRKALVFATPPAPAGAKGAAETQTVTVWSEGFESNTVPGDYWSAGDLQSLNGYDYWGDVSNSCAAWVHSGNWSAGCNGYGDSPSCTQYRDYEDAYMQNKTYFDMTGYATYDVSFYVRYQTESGYDFFRWYYSLGNSWIAAWDTSNYPNGYSGSSNWIQFGKTISNATHSADNFAVQFRFFSDYTNTDIGAFVDDILLRGEAPQPNLTFYQPQGWSAPIVPSSVTGTNTTGTLYAGQATYIDWAVQNNGAAAASGFYVEYYLDGNYISSDYVSSLSNGYYWPRMDWSYTVATSGTHTLKMVIDPSPGSISESNETDNTYQASFYWNPPPPSDLIVKSVVPSSTAPLVGSSINAAVTIKNQGTGLANGTFYTYLYKNPATPPTQGQLPYDDSHTTFSLAGGDSASYTVVGLSSPVAGTWTMYAYVDATNAIANESSESNNRTASATITWTPGNITVSGTLAYDDTSYTSAPRVNNRPMRCVKVELWDSDAGQGSTDDLLATTITNASGQFTFPTISNQDEADGGRQDLYLKAYFRSQEACLGKAAVLMVDATGSPWTFQSGTYQDIANGAVNLGTIKPLDYAHRSALNIYDAILRGYDWAVARGGIPLHPWYVRVQWQQNIETRTFYSYKDTTIVIAGALSTTQGDLRPNEWDNNAIFHEYAHHLAHVFGFDDPDVGGTHSPQTQSTSTIGPSGTLAWAEGCSHFLSCLIQSPISSIRQNTETNAGWTSTHVYEMDLETGILTYGGLAQGGPFNDQGWTWETPVGGTVWDIYDNVHDNQNGDACVDSLSDGLTRTWDVLSNHPGQLVTDIGVFYTLYCQRYGSDPTTARLLSKVFCEHGITTSGCTAVNVGDQDNDLPLTLSCDPNPVRGRAILSFSLPAAADDVRLRIYDVTGRLVADILDQPMTAGRHAVSWEGHGQNGGAVSSGLYFCRLSTPAGMKTASVLVVR